MTDDNNHTPYDPDSDEEEVTPPMDKELHRNLIAFWLIGLCNNLGFVVMLSAAFDILKLHKHGATKLSYNITHSKVNDVYKDSDSKSTHAHKEFHCNVTSTGLLLLAALLPDVLLRITAPFYIHRINYHVRVVLLISFLTTSLLLLSFSTSILVSVTAAVLSCIGAGLGEITFLSLSSHFKKSTLSAWSSGTGMAGIVGSVVYAGLLQVGLSRRNAVLSLLVIPLTYAMSVWILLRIPTRANSSFDEDKRSIEYDSLLKPDEKQVTDRTKDMSLKKKLLLICSLRKYMIPLILVYLAKYTINQGLYELLYYKIDWLNQAQQYRWFHVDYQIAVFIARSSISIFRTKNILILSLCQCAIFLLFLFEVIFTYIPSIWITLLVIFLEGFIGGTVYVNTFFTVTEEVDEDLREFSLGVAAVGISIGMSLAGAIALPLHDVLCLLKKR